MRLLKSKPILWLVAGVCILSICLAVFSKPFTTAVLKRIIYHRLANLTYHFEDGLHAGLCGTGSPMADIKRAGPCISVVAEKHLY
jgi:ribonuclease Z